MTYSDMTTSINSELTDEQQRIVNASPKERILVTAGPGTGKTHTLIARLAALVESHGISPGHELLVLSFSRAAVREIRIRLLTAGRDVRYVRAYTFDSFATRLLSEIEPNGPWTGYDYEGRIRYATSVMLNNVEAKQRISDYVHVLVDEIQDLVGERIEFVQAILETVTGGFTLLGDPAQGIYNFQLEGEARRIGSRAFYTWLHTRFGKTIEQYSLTKNHRAQTQAARAALSIGAALNSPNPNYEDIKYSLETVVQGLKSLGKLEHAIPILQAGRARTAILCRTNGQALMLSRKLHEAGVEHCLQRNTDDRVLPSWIATLFAAIDQKQIGKTAFNNIVSELFDPLVLDPQTAWKLLKRIDTKRTDTLDIKLVSDRIRVGNVPDDLTQQPMGNLIISTIHRAKGLEFERVVIVEPEDVDEQQDIDGLAEETRVLYVALTRPKRELLLLESSKNKGLRKDADTNRWVRKYGWKTNSIEVCGKDIHSSDPAGGYVLENCDPVATQAYIRSNVRVGDSVTLHRVNVLLDGKARTFYAVKHAGHVVGVTTEEFSYLLYRILTPRNPWNWPSQLDKLYVEAVDTVAGTDAASKRCGLGSSGMWLRVRVSGLGHCVFAGNE